MDAITFAPLARAGLLLSDFQVGGWATPSGLRRDGRVAVKVLALAAAKNRHRGSGIHFFVPGGVGSGEGVVSAMRAGDGHCRAVERGKFDLKHLAIRVSAFFLQFLVGQLRISFTIRTAIIPIDRFALAAKIDRPGLGRGCHPHAHFLKADIE